MGLYSFSLNALIIIQMEEHVPLVEKEVLTKRSELYAWLNSHNAEVFYNLMVNAGIESVDDMKQKLTESSAIFEIARYEYIKDKELVIQGLLDAITGASKHISTTAGRSSRASLSSTSSGSIPESLARYSMLDLEEDAANSLLSDILSATKDTIPTITAYDTKPPSTPLIQNPALLKLLSSCKLINEMYIDATVSIDSFADATQERLANGSLRHLVPVSKKKRKFQVLVDNINAVTSLKKPEYRSGRWTKEEEAYIHVLIEEFEAGTLPLSNGTMLRMFIGAVLNCERMRVSKKFAGRGPRKNATESMGQHVFCRNTNMINWMSVEELECRRNRLVYHELEFYNKIYQLQIEPQDRSREEVPPMPLYMGWHTYNPKTNPIITYFGAFRSANGGRKTT